jgi:hypothetical protein
VISELIVKNLEESSSGLMFEYYPSNSTGEIEKSHENSIRIAGLRAEI